jgi:hypothetical protein
VDACEVGTGDIANTAMVCTDALGSIHFFVGACFKKGNHHG